MFAEMGHATMVDSEAGGASQRDLPKQGLHLSTSGDAPPAYHLLTVPAGRHQFLAGIFAAFGVPTLRVWTEAGVSGDTFDRPCSGGHITAIAECDGRQVGIVWSDFRVNGASYGRVTSSRLAAFLCHLRRSEDAIPLIFVVNSAGVSIMEGRTAFSAAFGIWPELLRYSEDHLVFTCAVGKCLGLAPLLFGLGHYRVAVADRTQLNLTGPDVLRMFFGRGGCDFEQRSSAERCVERHDLVHELVPTTEAAVHLFRDLLARSTGSVAAGVPRLGRSTASRAHRSSGTQRTAAAAPRTAAAPAHAQRHRAPQQHRAPQRHRAPQQHRPQRRRRLLSWASVRGRCSVGSWTTCRGR
jgi:hypothetical protein